METDVDPIDYGLNHAAEGHISSPHRVFIKTEPQTLSVTFSEEMSPTQSQQLNDTGMSNGPFSQLVPSLLRSPKIAVGQIGHVSEQKIIASYGQQLLEAKNEGQGPDFEQHESFKMLDDERYQPIVNQSTSYEENPQDIHMVHIGQKRVFPCDVCGKIFTQKYNLTRHMSLHSKHRKYSCDVCAKTYIEKYQLTKHMLTHEEKKPFACHICKKDFILKYMLKNHMMTHTGYKPFACACGLRFRQIGALNRHRSGKYTKKTFQCDYCMKVFKQKTHLIRHIAFHTGEKRYECQVCHKKFSQQSNLYTHRQIHTEDKRYSCEVCDKKFRNAQHLSRHKNVHGKEALTHENAHDSQTVSNTEHDMTDDEEYNRVIGIQDDKNSIKQEKSQIKPEINVEQEKPESEAVRNTVLIKSEPEDLTITCDIEIVKQEPYENHENIIYKKNPPKGCPYAETKINLPEEYLEKKRKKLYPCDVCQKVFIKPFNLKRHKVTHSNSRPFKCNECSKTFYLKMHLNSHMKTHSGLKPYRCDICTSSFNRKWPLARHLQLCHSDENRFSCNQCNKTFAKESHLIKHQTRACKTISEVKKLKRIVKKTKALDKRRHNEMVVTRDPVCHDPKIAEFITSKCEDLFICNRCDLIYKEKHLLILHFKAEKCRKSLVPCKYCSKNFTETYLTIHEQTHKELVLFTCKTCMKSFTNNSDLYDHESMHKKSQTYQCDVCSMTYTTNTYLTRHRETHKPPFICKRCKKSYEDISEFVEHKSTHPKERTLYECEFCFKSFKRGDLTRHRRIHTGERPYKCELCDRTFQQPSSLRAHKFAHITEKPYACRICKKEFKSFNHMNRHKKIHVEFVLPDLVTDASAETEESTLQSAKTETFAHQFTRNENLASQSEKTKNLAGPSANSENLACQSAKIENLVSQSAITKNFKSQSAKNKKLGAITASTAITQQKTEDNDHVESIIVKIEPGDMPLTYEDYNDDQEDFILPEKNISTDVNFDRKEYHSANRENLSPGKHSQFSNRQDQSSPRKVQPSDKPNQVSNKRDENNHRFFCNQCQRGFRFKHSLIQHLAPNKNCTEPMRFPCKYCSKFFTKKYIKLHERTHTGERPYFCMVCSKTFARSSHLSEHMLTHNEARPYICQVCDRSFIQKAVLRRHELTHVDKKYTCDICSKKFSRASYLAEHKRLHSGEKPYSCDVCSKSFFRSCTLAQHKVIHSDDKPFQCTVCKKGYAQRIHLQLHEMSHYDAFTCNICDKIFTKKRYLARHKKIHEKNKSVDGNLHVEEDSTGINIELEQVEYESDQVKETPSNVVIKQEPQDIQSEMIEENIFSPTIIVKIEPDDTQAMISDKNIKQEPQETEDIEDNKSYNESDAKIEVGNDNDQYGNTISPENDEESISENKDINSLKHEGIQDDENANQSEIHRCEICPKTFHRRRNLIRHKVCHTGQKSFVCKVCTKAFARSSTLKRHQLVHTNDKRHYCEQCDRYFSQKDHLLRHLVVHTQEKNFGCDQCSKWFTRKSGLLRHKLSHTDKRYMCPVCQKTFTRKHHLDEHSLLHTGEKPISCDKCDMKFTFKTAYRRHKRLTHAFVEESADKVVETKTVNVAGNAEMVDFISVKAEIINVEVMNNLAKEADSV